jgi:hypothetical protein
MDRWTDCYLLPPGARRIDRGVTQLASATPLSNPKSTSARLMLTMPRRRSTRLERQLIPWGATRVAWGTNSRRSSSRFAPSSPLKKLIPVRFPAGRARFATRPSFTGSSPTTKTTGIVVVAAFAAKVGLIGKPRRLQQQLGTGEMGFRGQFARQRQCPLWVISGHSAPSDRCPHPKADIGWMPTLCHDGPHFRLYRPSFSATIFSTLKIDEELANAVSASYAIASNGLSR